MNDVTMSNIHFIAFIMLILTFAFYYVMKRSYIMKGSAFSVNTDIVDKKEIFAIKTKYIFIGILVISILIRIYYAMKYSMHTDLSCFTYWSDHIYNVGFKNFYLKASFADYPPGYMYILYVVAAIKNLFGISYYATAGGYTAIGVLFIKSPAIIFDVVTGIIIYKIARKKLNSISSLVCFTVYILNPIVILNSAVWGQVDSVFSIGIIIMCYLIYTDRTKYAYFAYGAAVLIKPQAFLFTPVLIFAFLEEVFLKHEDVISKEGGVRFKFNGKNLLTQLKWSLLAILATFVLLLPFGNPEYLHKVAEDYRAQQMNEAYSVNLLIHMSESIESYNEVDSVGDVFHNTGVFIEAGFLTAVEKYTSTMSSYEYASVNAYNFWCMFGLDWQDQNHIMFGLSYQQWGTLAILAICVIATFIWLIRVKDRSRYFMIAIFISVTMFIFAVRMHERYIYPAVIMMLILFIINKHKQMFWLYGVFSIAHFYNAAHVLFFYDSSNFDNRNGIIIGVSLLHVILFAFFMGYVYIYFLRGQEVDVVNVDTEGKSILIDEQYKDKNDNKDNIDKNDNKDKKDKKYNNKGNKNKMKVNSKKNTTFKENINKLLLLLKEHKWFTSKTVESSKKFSKVSKKEWIILGLITLVYAIIALHDLGDKEAPQSMWEVNDYNIDAIFEFPEDTHISRISFYLGNYEERSFSLNTASESVDNYDNFHYETKTEDNGETYEVKVANKTSDYVMNSVFCWSEWNLDAEVRYLKLTSLSNCCAIGELVFFDKNGNTIKPINADSSFLKELFDEQDLYPENYSFRNSTYFDEIYHARTAYEFIHGLYSYENTHPPLGKVFIALGMLVFGATPFGWRIAGTLFGIIMVPVIFLFAKKLFKRTDITVMTTLLFTFDFMHFSQTRIATIDVFVTLFVILMYYFMYQYYSMSFYDNKLWKTFIPLGLSAISMGLGCASKWTGCYAGAGLGVLFFIVMYKRFCEYRYAKNNIDGSTNGINHSHIVKVFKKYFWSTIAYCFGVFIVLAGTIYTLSYIPFVSGNLAPDNKFVTGRMVNKLCIGEGAIFPLDSLIGKMLGNIYTMYSYHSQIVFEHPYASKWFEWPLVIRPIWYYSGVVDENTRQGISAMGNPFVWWAGIAAFVYMCYRIYKYKDKMSIFFVIAYMAQYLPWILVSRLTFIYHYFPSVPFVVLMIGYSMYNILEKKPKMRKILIGYTVACVLLFVLFYPVLSGQSIKYQTVLTWLRWFDSWQLVSYK